MLRVGDLIDSILALLVVRAACRMEDGLPVSLKLKMFLNVVLDFVVGLVPVLGDVADALLKANVRNSRLLEEYLTQKG